jgi:phospholipid-binding lipoprotein MlaA
MRKSLQMLLLAGFLLSSGCATVEGPTDPSDPWESYNRSMYSFNESVDKAILKPVAEGYVEIVPTTARKGISNFFSNLDDVLVLLNDILQLKFVQAASDFTRVLVNSTIGLYGLVDVASNAGVRKHNEDIGQTLGYWGVPSGPYLVLPLFGPSSPRDGFGLYTERRYLDLVDRHVDDNATENVLVATDLINTRAQLLGASRLLDVAALDPYEFMRDAYLQRRQNLVYDGNPPLEDFYDDEFEDLPDEP